MPELLWIGSFGLDVEIEYEEIVHNLGSGNAITIKTGHSLGTKYFRLIFNYLPDAQGQFIANPETGTNQSRARYIWWFWNKRKQDGLQFDVFDPFDEVLVKCEFEDSRLSLHSLAAKLWSSQLRVRQSRP